jgi:hypothetical protein
LKTSPIWAALISSVVLLLTVSPVLAATQKQQFPTHQNSNKSFTSIEFKTATKGTFILQDDRKDGYQPVDLQVFSDSVINGNADQITGLYVPEFGGFYVIQQTAGNDGIVSQKDGILTQFLRPASNRVIALLAHNTGSGILFDRFPSDSLFYVIFGDGRQEIYRLSSKIRYQAVDENSTNSNLIDLSNGIEQSAKQVYQTMYSGKPHLTLQTCIQQGDNLDWGRLFLLADLVE